MGCGQLLSRDDTMAESGSKKRCECMKEKESQESEPQRREPRVREYRDPDLRQ